MPRRRSRHRSFNSLLQRARREFFRHLSEIDWTPFALALLCLLAMQLARAWAWRNVLRAAYPGKPIPFLPLSAAYLAGAGINAIVPAHAGDVTKVFLVKRQIPRLLLPGGHLLLPRPDRLRHHGRHPRPPLRDHPGPAAAAAAAPRPARLRDLLLGRTPAGCFLITVGVLLLGDRDRDLPPRPPRARASGTRVKQGVVILTEPRRYLREVAAWQGVGWLCRFAAFWFFLEAFGIGGSVGNVMLVMSVQAIANIVPFTPGGAGAQQALLVATLNGPSRTAVLSFSVGTQIAMAAWSVVLGFAAILLVFRTTDWRGLIRQARDEADSEKARRRRRSRPARP